MLLDTPKGESVADEKTNGAYMVGHVGTFAAGGTGVVSLALLAGLLPVGEAMMVFVGLPASAINTWVGGLGLAAACFGLASMFWTFYMVVVHREALAQADHLWKQVREARKDIADVKGAEAAAKEALTRALAAERSRDSLVEAIQAKGGAVNPPTDGKHSVTWPS